MDAETSGPPLLKPLPRRPFSTSGSASPQPPPRASAQLLAPDPQQDSDFADADAAGSANPRSRSFLNLTASTLFGIYATTGAASTGEPSTPWDAGAETPARKDSLDQGGAASPTATAALCAITGGGRSAGRRGAPINGDELERRLLRDRRAAPSSAQTPAKAAAPPASPPASPLGPSSLAVRTLALFAVGVLYGALVAHLHDGHAGAGAGLGSLRERLAGVAASALQPPDARSAAYLAAWGAAGVLMGSLLPWVDGCWRGSGTVREARGAAWQDVVRSVGAFVGIAFAIRRLPWETTQQLSLTLALTNPFLWYLVDGTAAGLALSSAIGFVGSATILAVNPALIPAPTTTFLPVAAAKADAVNGTGSAVGREGTPSEMLGVATWLASVLFCSCVCFGNVGRLIVARQRRSVCQ